MVVVVVVEGWGVQGVEEWGRGEWKHLTALVHDVSGEPQIE